jgi:hypothetical protein
MKGQLYINQGSTDIDNIFDTESQYIILNTGKLKGGKKEGQYSIKYVAAGKCYNMNFHKTSIWTKELFLQRISDQYAKEFYMLYGFDYSDHLIPIEPSKLALYIDWSKKSTLFHKILTGQYKRI